jgi:SSS family solute:Na+ symporter
LTSTQNGFSGYDWLAMGLYAMVLLLSGLWLGRRKQSGTQDYFLAGRGMPAWAVAISVLATSLSVATFIGGPEQAYRSNLTYLSSTIGAVLAAVFVALVFIPAFYRHRVETVYELLEIRFGPIARRAASSVFLIGRVFSSGARIFIAALPASLILYGDFSLTHLATSVTALTFAGILYTLAGGVRSVIWSDVIQTIVFLGAAVTAAILLLDRIPLGFDEILSTLAQPGSEEPSKLAVFEIGLNWNMPYLGFDPSDTYTLLTALTGMLLLNIGAYGTDHDLAQRMMTCRTSAKGSWSMIIAILIGLPVTLLFLAIGLLLYIFYSRPELMGAAGPGYGIASYGFDETRQVFLSFILHEMPPGMAGLMMAGLFAAGLSSVNSALNAMGSSLVNDWYRSLFPGREEQHYLRVSHCAVVGCGMVIGGFAMGCIYWQRIVGQSLIDFALSVMAFAYSGLLAVFLTAFFTRRGNETTTVLALVTGFLAVLVLQPWVLVHWTPAAWEGLRIAFPWQIVISTAIATVVCCMGRPGAAGGVQTLR